MRSLTWPVWSLALACTAVIGHAAIAQQVSGDTNAYDGRWRIEHSCGPNPLTGQAGYSSNYEVDVRSGRYTTVWQGTGANGAWTVDWTGQFSSRNITVTGEGRDSRGGFWQLQFSGSASSATAGNASGHQLDRRSGSLQRSRECALQLTMISPAPGSLAAREQEQAERQRLAEEQRRQQEEAAARRAAEERRQREQAAQRAAAQQRAQQAAAERAAQEQRQRETEEQRQRLAAEEERQRQITAQREADERRVQDLSAQLAAQEQRLRQLAAEREAEERRLRALAEERRIQELAGQREAEERRLRELTTRREAEEQRLQQLATQSAADDQGQRQREAAQRAAEEQRQRETAQRAVEEQRQREAAQRAAEEQRQREAAQRAAEEQRQREAAQRLEAEAQARQIDNALRQATEEVERRRQATERQQQEERIRNRIAARSAIIARMQGTYELTRTTPARTQNNTGGVNLNSTTFRIQNGEIHSERPAYMTRNFGPVVQFDGSRRTWLPGNGRRQIREGTWSVRNVGEITAEFILEQNYDFCIRYRDTDTFDHNDLSMIIIYEKFCFSELRREIFFQSELETWHSERGIREFRDRCDPRQPFRINGYCRSVDFNRGDLIGMFRGYIAVQNP